MDELIKDIDINKGYTQELPALDFVFAGLRTGTVGALVSPGGTGKSMFALQAAMAVACNAEGQGSNLLNLDMEYHGKVVYIATEDDELVLLHRIQAIGQYQNVDVKDEIIANMRLITMVGAMFDITKQENIDWLCEAGDGKRLIVLDTLSKIHMLDENSNGDMAVLLRTLQLITQKTGAGVLFLHHTNKGSARDGIIDQQSARGASALLDNARWGGYVAKMNDHEKLADEYGHVIGKEERWRYLKFGVNKINYGKPIEERWYKRYEGGVLMPTKLIKTNQKEQETEYEENYI